MAVLFGLNLQNIIRWWTLDLKNGQRTPEEVEEYSNLGKRLLRECKFRNETHMRSVAARIVAQKLREIK